MPAFLRSQVGISLTDVCWRLNFIMAGRCHSTGIAGVWILRIASFIKSEEQHITVIPMDSHTAFYFPPPASKDRAVHSMEIKDFNTMDLQPMTTSPCRHSPLSPEREIFRKLSYTPTYNYEQSSQSAEILPGFPGRQESMF